MRRTDISCNPNAGHGSDCLCNSVAHDVRVLSTKFLSVEWGPRGCVALLSALLSRVPNAVGSDSVQALRATSGQHPVSIVANVANQSPVPMYSQVLQFLCLSL